jgi:hypothetical protein
VFCAMLFRLNSRAVSNIDAMRTFFMVEYER